MGRCVTWRMNKLLTLFPFRKSRYFYYHYYYYFIFTNYCLNLNWQLLPGTSCRPWPLTLPWFSLAFFFFFPQVCGSSSAFLNLSVALSSLRTVRDEHQKESNIIWRQTWKYCSLMVTLLPIIYQSLCFFIKYVFVFTRVRYQSIRKK